MENGIDVVFANVCWLRLNKNHAEAGLRAILKPVGTQVTMLTDAICRGIYKHCVADFKNGFPYAIPNETRGSSMKIFPGRFRGGAIDDGKEITTIADEHARERR